MSTASSTQSPEDAEPLERRARSACDVTIVAHDVGGVGGMELILAELILGLRRRGHEVTVIARKCELPPSAGITFHRVRGPRRPFLLAYPWFMVAGSIAVRRRRRGLVQAMGGIVLNRVDLIMVQYCHQVGRATPSRSTVAYRAHVVLVGILKRAAERLCFRVNRSATFVCASEGVADDMRAHFPAAADRLVTIHNGVDTERFAPGVRPEAARALRATLEVSDDRLIAAFVGSEWERKGLEPVIRALAAAPDWDLVVAGGGDRAHYQQLADSLGVGAAVHWLGVTSDVQVVYALADAMVFPTSYEGFPLVSLEAAASGLPVLATPVNGVRELVRDGENGWLVSREPRSIAERLGQLARDPALRKRMGEAARESALGFRWARMVDRHDDLYAELTGESGQ
jgi:glycosyltransferase involved in cell wall biosynthesis